MGPPQPSPGPLPKEGGEIGFLCGVLCQRQAAKERRNSTGAARYDLLGKSILFLFAGWPNLE